MPKTLFLATDANGNVHKRTSQNRTYTHTVVAKRSMAESVRCANAQVKNNTRHALEQIDHAERSIEEIKDWLRAKRCNILCQDDVYATKLQTEGRAFYAKWSNGHGREQAAAAYAAHHHMETIARIVQQEKDGYFNVFVNHGWCGRKDLAQKLYNSILGFEDKQILEANRA